MARVAAPTVAPPLARQRVAVLVVLLALAAVGWSVFLAQATGESRDMGGTAAMTGDDAIGTGGSGAMTAPDLSMGGSAPFFLASWTAMMAAMMLPAASPMILMYARTQRSHPVRTGLFTGAYLVLWTVFGVAAFALAAGIERGVEQSAFVARHWARAGGALILAAGLYQLSPLKGVCLRHCRSPLAFVLAHWRDGATGAVRMGLHHGLYCAGCCWLLFLVLVPIGVMNVAAMLLVAIVVFAEKALPGATSFTRVAAAGLVVYGTAVTVSPGLLPTVA